MLDTVVKNGAAVEGEIVPSGALERRQENPLARIPEADRRLLSPQVITRWSSDLAPDDLTPELLSEIAQLERNRQKSLKTLRSTAELTDLEFRLVRYLQKSEGRTRTYLQLAHHLWGTPEHPITAAMLRAHHGYAAPMVASIQVLVCNIRKKLEIDPLRPQHVATIRGVGYRWYSAPPSLDDGEDYARRAIESSVLRQHMQHELGIIDDPALGEMPDDWEPGMPVLGPEYPARLHP
jgi:hypothetical protein